MRAREALDAPEALVLTMVLVAAADGGMTDREIGVMSGQVQTLPVFHEFTTEQLATATDAAVRLLNEEDGLQHAGRLMRGALEPRLRETAYALACEVVAASQVAKQRTLEMLDFVRDELRLDPLIAAAIERGVRARHQRIEARANSRCGCWGPRRSSPERRSLPLHACLAVVGWAPVGRRAGGDRRDAAGRAGAGAVLGRAISTCWRRRAPHRRGRDPCRAGSPVAAGDAAPRRRPRAAGTPGGRADRADRAAPSRRRHGGRAAARSADRAGGGSRRAARQFGGARGVR